MAICEEGEDELRAGIAGSNPAEIDVICAGRGVIGRDLRAKRSTSSERRVSAVTGSSLGIINWVGKKSDWKEEGWTETYLQIRGRLDHRSKGSQQALLVPLPRMSMLSVVMAKWPPVDQPMAMIFVASIATPRARAIAGNLLRIQSRASRTSVIGPAIRSISGYSRQSILTGR